MAVADYIPLVQSLYISYFGRPADTLGAANFAAQLDALKAPTDVNGLTAAYKTNTGIKALIDSFGTSAESAALYTGDNVAFVTAIYNNVLNRAPDFDGLVYWATEINSGRLTKANASLAIMAGAYNNTTAQGLLDKATLEAKVAIATAFTAAIDTGAELAGYSGNAAASTAREMLKTVTATSTVAGYAATIEATIAKIVTDGIPVTVTALTAGVDTFAGTLGSDTINGSNTTFTALDKIDGGAGNDRLVLSDVVGGALDVSIASVSNVETLELTSTGALGQNAANVSGWTGLTAATFITKATVGQTITAAGTTDVTVSNTGDGAITVVGGEDVAVTTGAAAISVASNTLKTATIKGGTTVSVSDNGKDTLTSVTIGGNTGAATLTGDLITTVAVTAASVGNITVNAAAATRDLKLSLKGATAGTISDITATSVSIDATGAAVSGITLNTDAATAITISGDKTVSMALSDPAGDSAIVKTITSTNTAGVTITGGLAAGTAFTGAAGADKVTVGATTSKIATGAGNDTVTVSVSALGTAGAIDAGEGTDTLVMSAANAATASAGTDFAAAISGFEKLSLDSVAGATTAVVNLANLDNINYVISAGTTGVGALTPAVAEKTEVTITAAADGADTITFDGTTVTLADGDTTAQIATKLAAASFTNYTTSVAGSVVTFTNKVGGVSTDLVTGNFVVTNVDPAAVAAPVVAVTQQGSAGATAVSEVQTVLISAGPATGAYQFLGHVVAGSVAGDDETVAALRIVADKAAIIASWNALNPTRELTNITSSGATLTLTYANTEGDVAVVTGVTTGGLTIDTSAQTVQGVVFSAAQREIFTATMSGTSGGADTLTFEGETITFADGDTAAQMAAKVVAQSGGAFTNYTVTANGAVLTFTNLANQGEADAVAGDFTMFNDTTNGVAALTAAVTVQGVNAIPGPQGILNLTNLASGGTLELTGAGFQTVGVKDASSGTADVLNVILKSDGAVLTAFDTVNVANVETVNITTVNTNETPAHTDSLTLQATAAKSIVISGNAGVNLTNTGNTKVTSFDASGVTVGSVTFASANTTSTASVSIKGGAGADTLTGNVGTDTISGGAGADLIDGGLGQDFLSGGAGKDTFVQSTASTSGVSYDTITDLAAGDIIRVVTITNADANASVAGVQLGAMVTGLDPATAVFQDFLDAAANKANGIVSWFQFGGNTYLVQDNAPGSATFQNTVDNAIKLTGLIDLTNSTIVGTDLTIV